MSPLSELALAVVVLTTVMFATLAIIDTPTSHDGDEL